nr:DUF2281 domain-containing protein [uncultured Arsenicibacter sp.]
MSIIEQIDQKASQLPADLQAEVLTFIEFLEAKQAKKTFVSPASVPHLPNKRGAGKGLITYVADDFDAPLDDFKEYM